MFTHTAVVRGAWSHLTLCVFVSHLNQLKSLLGRNTHAHTLSVCLVVLFFRFTLCRLRDSLHRLFPFTFKRLTVEFLYRSVETAEDHGSL